MTSDTVFEVDDKQVAYARTFSDAVLGTCFWYENSNGLVEIAANQAHVDDLLSLTVGSPLSIVQDA